MNQTIRVYLVCFFLAIIIAMCIVIYSNKDTIFRHEVNITYPDQCVEQYVNGKLMTPECIEGREMAERMNTPNNFGVNLSWQNPQNNIED